jgi:hypothetical protein
MPKALADPAVVADAAAAESAAVAYWSAWRHLAAVASDTRAESTAVLV